MGKVIIDYDMRIDYDDMYILVPPKQFDYIQKNLKKVRETLEPLFKDGIENINFYPISNINVEYPDSQEPA